jgi:surface protein
MVNDCEVLQSISEDSKWSTNDVANMSYMFCNCKALSHLPRFISKWDFSKVKNMSSMFSGCISLK